MEELNDGLRKKIELLESIYSPCHLLLLDKPTNTLDLQSINILEEMIKKDNGIVVVVYHDVVFLSAVFTHIIRITYMKLKTFKGNFSEFRRMNKMSNEKIED